MATTQFCLTNAGTNLIGPTVSLLSDLDNFTSEFQTGVLLSSLQPPNCPVTLTVPDGATQVRVYDPNSNACATVNLDGNDLCTLFNLTFSEVQTNTVSKIVFGDITSSFGVVTDYLIYWYRNGESTPQYISGKGSLFTPYSFTHPLTNSGAILAQSGTYTIDIAKIRINGINFTTLDTPPAGFVKMSASCLPIITVSAFNCGNGDFTPSLPGLDYTHKFSFNQASVGVPPQSLSATFDLSWGNTLTDTNYLAFNFVGDAVYDILKITFYGDNYAEPIILESIAVGSNSQTLPGALGTRPNSINRNVAATSFKKVLNFTMLNRSINDYLEITVTPNPVEFGTIWELYLRCLTTINCTDCTDQFVNQHPKLYLSDVTSTVISCQALNVNFKIQGCSQSSLESSDLRKFFELSNSLIQGTGTPSKYSVTSSNISSNIRSCSYILSNGTNPFCSGTAQGTTNFTTSLSNGVFCMTYQISNSANFNTFVSQFQNQLAAQQSIYPNYNNPLHPHYFRYIVLRIPSSSGCGDIVPALSFNVPLWGNFTIDNTTNTINFCYNTSSVSPSVVSNYIAENNITNCDIGCSGHLNSVTNDLSNQANASPVSISNSTGGYYTNNFGLYGGYQQIGPDLLEYGLIRTSQMRVYANTTYMLNTSGQLINNNPNKVCNFESLGFFINSNVNYDVTNALSSYQRNLINLKITPRVPYNPTYPGDFEIKFSPIINGGFQAPQVVVYSKFDDIVTTNNSYII